MFGARAQARSENVSFAMPSVRGRRATDDVTRDLAGRLVRFGLVVLGFLIILLGIAIAPLPGRSEEHNV